MSSLRGGVVKASRAGFHRELGSLDGVFRFLGEFADAVGVDERTALCIDLVVEELFTNMVKYNDGGGDQIVVGLERVGDRLHIELVDNDVEPFDPAGVPDPAVAAGIADRRPGGLGLHLVRSMVDDLHYEYEPETRQMRVSVTKVLEN